MYLPAPFREDDTSTLFDVIDANGFGALVTFEASEPFVSHVPFVLERAGRFGVLRGHVARANPHARAFDGRRALAIFTGVHGYVSPSDYASAPQVPTWNYVAVHAHGALRRVEGEGLSAILDALVLHHEAGMASPWSTRALPSEFRASLERAIVGFEIVIERLEGKAKLGQNRSREDRHAAIAALRARGDVALADAMARALANDDAKSDADGERTREGDAR